MLRKWPIAIPLPKNKSNRTVLRQHILRTLTKKSIKLAFSPPFHSDCVTL